MEPGILIKAERLKRGWSQEKLAAMTGISQPAIRKIEKGDTKKSKFFPNIAEALGIPLHDLDPSLSQHGEQNVNQANKVNHRAHNQTLNMIPGKDLMGDVDLPVFLIARGGRGAITLENEPFTHTSRPKRLIGKKRSYGVLIIGDAMAREYNQNDIAYVDPDLHPQKDDPCIFQGVRPDGIEVMIGYLDRATDASESVYYVRQTNPARRFTIKKLEWQKCHVLVGKESGR